jgi:hypothetical protein
MNFGPVPIDFEVVVNNGALEKSRNVRVGVEDQPAACQILDVIFERRRREDAAILQFLPEGFRIFRPLLDLLEPEGLRMGGSPRAEWPPRCPPARRSRQIGIVNRCRSPSLMPLSCGAIVPPAVMSWFGRRLILRYAAAFKPMTNRLAACSSQARILSRLLPSDSRDRRPRCTESAPAINGALARRIACPSGVLS